MKKSTIFKKVLNIFILLLFLGVFAISYTDTLKNIYEYFNTTDELPRYNIIKLACPSLIIK